MESPSKNPNYFQSGAWALAAAACYAIQHPCQKPFVDKFDKTIVASLTIAFIGELVLLAAFVLVYIFRPKTRESLKHMASRERMAINVSIWRIDLPRIVITIILSFVSLISVMLYSYELRQSETIFLSLGLNLFAVYNIFISSVIYKDRPPLYAYVALAMGLGVILLTDWYVKGIHAGDITQTLVISIIPICFAIRGHLFHLAFGEKKEYIKSRVLVMSVFDAPVLLLGLFVGSQIFDVSPYIPTDEGILRWILFFIAIICSGILGGMFLQDAMARTTDRASKWYPGMFFLLIPFLVMIVGSAVTTITGFGDTKFSVVYLPGAVTISIIIIFVGLRKKADGERKIER